MTVHRHKGYLCLVLHAHLPYVRHPEHEFFLEENWLYEAITETYIPLLETFTRLIDEGIDFRITLSLSPVLIEMLSDELLMERYDRHLGRLLELVGGEVRRTKGDIHFEPVARLYQKRFSRVHYLFQQVYKRNLVHAFRQLQETGRVQIIASAATHAFLPNLCAYPRAVKAQITIGSRLYRKNFGRRPEGIWLPECGFVPGFDDYVREEGMRFFFLETHGVTHSAPAPLRGVYAPVVCPSGAFVFGRDVETSMQVWSSFGGYPGDFEYRDFYRDVGFDLDQEHIRNFLEPFGTRTFTGLKYYKITGRTDRKESYVREVARDKFIEHAGHFIMQREKQIELLSESLKIRPVIAAIYDAELFGHWWFEGPEWLEEVLRGIHQRRRNFTTVTPSEYLSMQTTRKGGVHVCTPSISSWGEKGYNEVWLNKVNDYTYRHLLKATERMGSLAERYPDAEGILKRALNQAIREILLAQHSDWTFIMRRDTAVEYARRRFEEHIGRFTVLYHSILSGHIPEKWLSETEDRDRIFQDIDYRVYCSGK
jgi:1,4-alpha-glucan branching enzyme